MIKIVFHCVFKMEHSSYQRSYKGALKDQTITHYRTQVCVDFVSEKLKSKAALTGNSIGNANPRSQGSLS